MMEPINKKVNGDIDGTKEAGDVTPEVEVRCGYGKCRPGVLQICNNSKVLLGAMCIFVFTQGFVVNGIFNVIVSTLERRFLLRSTTMGWVVATYDFSAALFGVLISYLGSGRYKARWLMVAACFLFAGCIVMMLPHFTTGLYEYGQYKNSTCTSIGNDTEPVACTSSGLQNYVALFILSNILFAVGGATLYTVGTVYIDDSVPSVSSPLYLGIFFGFAALGPGVGFLIGGSFLKFYVDADRVDTSSLSITDTDPRWVGAWWIGPFLSALLFLVSIVILSCFGAELPDAEKIRETRECQLHKGSSNKHEVVDPGRPKIRELPGVFAQLFKNPPFIFTTLAGITETMLMSGLSSFGAKFIQNMFRVSAGSAGLLTGGITVIGLAGGITFGGFVCRCFRLRVQGMLKFSFGVCVISTLSVGMFFLSCGQTEITGVHSKYLASTDLGLQSSCNTGCGCSTENFQASCDSTGRQYFSPCHAGCAQRNTTTFSDCSCVPPEANSSVSMVTLGSCEKSCSMLYVFLVVCFIYTFTSIAADVPAEQAVLRSIPENYRTIMCGTNRFFVRLIGTFPGAVIMGAATDAGCLIWQTECGEDVACWVYDNSVISRNYFLIGIVTKVFSLLFFFLAYWFYVPPSKGGDGYEAGVDDKSFSVSNDDASGATQSGEQGGSNSVDNMCLSESNDGENGAKRGSDISNARGGNNWNTANNEAEGVEKNEDKAEDGSNVSNHFQVLQSKDNSEEMEDSDLQETNDNATFVNDEVVERTHL